MTSLVDNSNGSSWQHRAKKCLQSCLSLPRRLREAMAAPAVPPPIPVANNMILVDVGGIPMVVPNEDYELVATYAVPSIVELGLRTCFAATVREGMVVVDAGANIGIYTVLAARLVGPRGKILSFEPNPRAFEALQANIALSGAARVATAHALALGDRVGQVEFNVYPHATRVSSLYGTTGLKVDRRTVEMSTLDAVLASEPRVDVVKLDVEGSEAAVFRGMEAILAANPRIQIFLEFAPSHFENAGELPRRFLEEVRRRGFQIDLVDERNGKPRRMTDSELLALTGANLLLKRES